MTERTGDAKGGYLLSDAQNDAVAGLASENIYVSQSKWQTFRTLPRKQRWGFFKQHFLLPVALAVLAIAFVASMVTSVVTKGPDAELSVTTINMPDISSQMQELGEGFVKSQGIEDERLVNTSGMLLLSDDNADSVNGMDESSALVTRIAAGQINAMIVAGDYLSQMVERDAIADLTDALDIKTLQGMSAALVGPDGQPVDDADAAVGLSLGDSATWMALEGVPDDAVLVMGNVQKDVYHERMLQFVDYLHFH